MTAVRFRTQSIDPLRVVHHLVSFRALPACREYRQTSNFRSRLRSTRSAMKGVFRHELAARTVPLVDFGARLRLTKWSDSLAENPKKGSAATSSLCN
jgi:hypothetical protein